jgi:hypothetical protein
MMRCWTPPVGEEAMPYLPVLHEGSRSVFEQEQRRRVMKQTATEVTLPTIDKKKNKTRVAEEEDPDDDGVSGVR